MYSLPPVEHVSVYGNATYVKKAVFENPTSTAVIYIKKKNSTMDCIAYITYNIWYATAAGYGRTRPYQQPYLYIRLDLVTCKVSTEDNLDAPNRGGDRASTQLSSAGVTLSRSAPTYTERHCCGDGRSRTLPGTSYTQIVAVANESTSGGTRKGGSHRSAAMQHTQAAAVYMYWRALMKALDTKMPA
jgi:hypothetical protein